MNMLKVSAGTLATTLLQPPARFMAKGTAMIMPMMMRNTWTKSVRVTLHRPPMME